jgi:Xaa-Pro dipeptidase|tara:strand:+ start:5530 stop:6723 length:1194 start_codon:yes stop_codon:yes gene_type:complete
MINGYFIQNLDDKSKEILNTKYPLFSENEYKRRITSLEDIFNQKKLDKIIIYEAIGSGSAMQYFTGWHTTQEALAEINSGEKINLYVEHYNHLPMAETLINESTNLYWGERMLSQKIFPKMIDSLGKDSTIGIIGRLPYSYIKQIQEKNIKVIDVFSDYNLMRSIKSDEELSWLKIAAALTDEGISSLTTNLKPGLNEHEMSQITQSGYLKHGGHKIINFFGITNMDHPDNCVPYQYTSNKTITKDDIITTEISSHFWNYPGQVLRSIGFKKMNTLYSELHTVGDEVFKSIFSILKDGTSIDEINDISSTIEDGSFSIWDDLIHGYGGGYLDPVIGTKSRPASHYPDFKFKENMTVVIQPNIITRDHKAGIQTGELVHIQKNRAVRLHNFTQGYIQI